MSDRQRGCPLRHGVVSPSVAHRRGAGRTFGSANALFDRSSWFAAFTPSHRGALGFTRGVRARATWFGRLHRNGAIARRPDATEVGHDFGCALLDAWERIRHARATRVGGASLRGAAHDFDVFVLSKVGRGSRATNGGLSGRRFDSRPGYLASATFRLRCSRGRLHGARRSDVDRRPRRGGLRALGGRLGRGSSNDFGTSRRAGARLDAWRSRRWRRRSFDDGVTRQPRRARH
jgi:hypothetical protein